MKQLLFLSVYTKCITFCIIFIIFITIGGIRYTNAYNVTKTKTNTTPTTECCRNSSTHHIEIEFITKIVQNEYIVAFDGYYKSDARVNFLKAALDGSSQVLNFLHYYVLIFFIHCIFFFYNFRLLIGKFYRELILLVIIQVILMLFF